MARWQVVLDVPAGVEHRGDEQVGPEHVLAVEMGARRVPGELHHHRAQHRGALEVRGNGGSVQVRHEAVLEAGEAAQDVHGLAVDEPRHAVRLLPCRRLCDDSRPNCSQRLNTAGSGVPSKPPMSWLQKPKPESASESPPRSVSGHRFEGRHVVAAPVDRETLPAGRRRAGEDDRSRLAPWPRSAPRRRPRCRAACSSCASASDPSRRARPRRSGCARRSRSSVSRRPCRAAAGACPGTTRARRGW